MNEFADLNVGENKAMGNKILVIDDEMMICVLAERILSRIGYEVETVNSGSAALVLFAKSPSDYSVALIDQRMVGLSGLETLSELRKISPALPCILSSGNPLDERDVSEGLQENTWFLSKPYRSKQLSQMVSSILTSKPAQA